MQAISRFFRPSNISLIRELVVSDFKLRYQGSVLGYLWSLLRPLFMFGVLFVVFTRIIKLGNKVEFYAVYLLLGIVIWTFFVEATVSGMNAITGRGDLIRKVSIPKYTIVFSTNISAFVNFFFNMIVVAVFMVILRVPFHPLGWLILPLLLLELVVLCLSISFILAALFVKFRDFSHIWEVVLQALFYATPLIYTMDLPPLRIAKLIMLSPLAQIVQDARYLIVTKQTITGGQLLQHYRLGHLVPLVSIFVLAVFAAWYFRRSSKNFAEEL